MEHHLDEGMKEVLVYSRTNTDGPRRPRESSELVEVDLAGSQSRLALGTDSPLSAREAIVPHFYPDQGACNASYDVVRTIHIIRREFR
jgi:hypothetical protein